MEQRNIYEGYGLEAKLQRKGKLFDFSSDRCVSMLVPLSMFDLVTAVMERVIWRAADDGYFNYFPIGESLELPGNDGLKWGVIEAGAKSFDGSTSKELAELKVIEAVPKSFDEVYGNIFSSSGLEAPIEYIRGALGWNLVLPRVPLYELGKSARDLRGDDRYLNYYTRNRQRRFMKALNTRLEELEYTGEMVEELFLNASKAMPVVAGINIYGDSNIASMVSAGKAISNDTPNRAKLKSFKWWQPGRNVSALSSFFSIDIVSGLYVPGGQELMFLDKLKAP